MTSRTVYESPNVDVWRLVRDPQSGMPMVEHQPNTGSGGRRSLTEIGRFLRTGANAPEHHAVLQLIGTLVSDP